MSKKKRISKKALKGMKEILRFFTLDFGIKALPLYKIFYKNKQVGKMTLESKDET